MHSWRQFFPKQKLSSIVPESEEEKNPFAARSANADHETEPLWMRFARRMGIDRAVGFAVLARFWQLLTGPVTQLLIIFSFSEIQQGYYTAFMNLLAMHVFVELGLHVVIINIASHEWAGAELTESGIVADPTRRSRLISLGRTATRWYAVASLLFVVVVSILGIIFFLDIEKPAAESVATSADWLDFAEWSAPWVVLVLLTGLQLTLLPLSSILEGCGQLPVINRIRFWQGVVGSLVVWAFMAGGLGLWALCGSALVRLAGEFYLVAVRYRSFFKPFRKPATGEVIDWKQEVLPLQWRMAIQGSLLWLANHLAGLVIIKCHGAAASGRYGMMWTIFVAIQAASLSWIETRRPRFGQLIAEKDYVALDDLFFRMSRISLLLLTAGVSLFTLGVWVVNQLPYWFFERIASRLPDVLPTAIFAVAMVIMQLAQCTNIYVRAHKKDPFLLAAIVSNLTIAGLVLWLGTAHGIIGVAIGYLIGVALVQVPLWVIIWSRTRQAWHSDGAPV